MDLLQFWCILVPIFTVVFVNQTQVLVHAAPSKQRISARIHEVSTISTSDYSDGYTAEGKNRHRARDMRGTLFFVVGLSVVMQLDIQFWHQTVLSL